ncbi:MAG: winged helix-turn-helix transcriptional regulator [Thermoplasmatota archaeon]
MNLKLLTTAVLGLLIVSSVTPVASAGLFSSTTIHIPLPSVGDEVAYSLNESVAGGPGSVAGLAHFFEWSGHETTHDQWGRLRDVDVLHSYIKSKDRDGADAWFEARHAYPGGSVTPLWFASSVNLTGDVPVQGILGTPVGAANVHFSQSSTTLSYNASGDLNCDARSPMQGRAVSQGDTIPLEAICPAFVPPRGVTVTTHGAALTSYLGHAAVLLAYDAVIPANAGGPGNVTLTFLFADGLPYPAEIRTAGENAGKYGSSVDRLAQFRHGTMGPLLSPDATPELRQRPAATFAPWRAEGPATGGVDDKYPLTQAVASVEADRTLTNFQSWRSSHADALVFDAVFVPDASSCPTTAACSEAAQWTLHFGQDTDAFAVVTTRSLSASALAGLPVPPMTTNQEAGAYTIAGSRAPTRSELPAESLDFASAAREWQAYVPASLRAKEPSSFLFFASGGAASPMLHDRLGVIVSEDTSDGRQHQLEIYFDGPTGAVAQTNDGISMARASPTFPLADTPAVFSASFSSGPPVGAFTDSQIDFVAGAAVVSVLAIVLGVLAYFRGWFAPLFTRLKRSEILDNEMRAKLYEVISTEPGMHLAALEARSGIGHGATLYHLNTMEREGLVRTVELPGFRRYFVTGARSAEAMRALAVLASRSSRAVYDAVRAEPGITQLEVAERVGVSPPAVHRTVEKLAEAGLVERARDGKAMRLTAKEVEGLN